MSYFDHRRSQQPYQPAFHQEPEAAYPVDEDGDRIYSEDDYAVTPDGDAFVPDDTEEAPAGPYYAQPFSYMGAFNTMADTQEQEWLPEDAELLPDEELLTEEERRELRQSNWKLLAGLADFAAVILGTAAILILIALLVSLINWLVSDISQTFTLLQTHI